MIRIFSDPLSQICPLNELSRSLIITTTKHLSDVEGPILNQYAMLLEKNNLDKIKDEILKLKLVVTQIQNSLSFALERYPRSRYSTGTPE